VAQPGAQGLLVTLGCRAHRPVVVAARALTAHVILVVMAPLAGTVGAVSSPLVRSYEGISVTDMQEPGVEEPSRGEPCMEGSSHSQRGLIGSSAGWRLE
jgi:hypothetical protein